MKRTYSPTNLHLKYKNQIDLLTNGEAFSTYFKIRVIVGDFYETLAHEFFGGKRKNKQIIEDLGLRECEPDLENHKIETFIEVKASKYDNYFKIFTHQVEKYRSLLMNEFPYDLPGVNYAFFTYNIKEVLKECPNDNILIEKLSQKTLSLLVLPFGIIEEICKKSRKFNGVSYKPFHYFNVSQTRLFFKNPEESLKNYGVDPGDLKIEERLFPSNWTIEGNKITPFDVMKISYKDYEKWLTSFRGLVNGTKEQNLKDNLPF